MLIMVVVHSAYIYLVSLSGFFMIPFFFLFFVLFCYDKLRHHYHYKHKTIQDAYEEKHETNCLHHNEAVRKDSTR